MERTKKFQDFIDRLPETGTPLIEWHKWLTRNHFEIHRTYTDNTTNEITITYWYDEKRYRGYAIFIIIKSNTSVYYLKNKLEDYLTYEKKHDTAPITFKEYDKNIEEKNINYFHIRIYNNLNHNEDITVY